MDLHFFLLPVQWACDMANPGEKVQRNVLPKTEQSHSTSFQNWGWLGSLLFNYPWKCQPQKCQGSFIHTLSEIRRTSEAPCGFYTGKAKIQKCAQSFFLKMKYALWPREVCQVLYATFMSQLNKKPKCNVLWQSRKMQESRKMAFLHKDILQPTMCRLQLFLVSCSCYLWTVHKTP